MPISLGYAWNTLGARSVTVPGLEYHGRLPDSALAVEWFGTSALYVPFEARLRSYLVAGDLPLWNPYQGLGEVFAAQGEGSPYSPLAIFRALVPYRWGNLVSVAEFLLAAAFTVRLLRNLGLSQPAATSGGAAFALSGALALHIPRGNIEEQLCLLPPLIWAAERAVRRPSGAGPFVVLTVATGLVAMGGFIQIAMVALMVAGAFIPLYATELGRSWRESVRRTFPALGALGLGLALSAVHLLPVAEAIRVSHNPRGDSQAFITTPVPNLVAFFAPGVFGQLFQSWLPGSYPDIVDWNNLYGTASLGIGLLTVGGLASLSAAHGGRRFTGWFFGLAGLLLLLRYLSSPLVAGVNLLPILAQQTPKHANGVAVFCLVAAAAHGIDAIGDRRPSRALAWQGIAVAVLVSALLTFIGQRGGLGVVGGPLMMTSLGATATVLVVLLAAVVAVRRWQRLGKAGRATLLGTLLVAELTLYVPLGNSDLDLVGWRVGLFLLTALAGLALALGRRWPAVAGFSAALVGYALVVALPMVGLPSRFDADTPSAFMRWLRMHAGDEYRTFGVVPNYSSLGKVQDLGTIGPFVPLGFASFVDVVGNDAVRGRLKGANVFLLTGTPPPEAGFVLEDYARSRPLFDWLGVRYLVLDRAEFRLGGRSDHQTLLRTNPDLRVVYEDQAVIIVESPTAEPKATFAGMLRQAASRASVVDELKADPTLVRGTPRVDSSLVALAAGGATGSVTVDAYHPNRVRLTADTSGPGLVILKDAYSPGWEATVDGEAAPVVEVNAMVRGVPVAAAGRHTIDFTYRPRSVLVGAALSTVTLVVLVVLTVVGRAPTILPRRRVVAAHLLAGLLLLAFADAGVWAFSGRSMVTARLLDGPPAPPERLASATSEVAQYLPDPPPGLTGTAADPERARLPIGQLALLGSSGGLIRVVDGGREVAVVGEEGQRVRVDGIGPWSVPVGRHEGLVATYTGGRWVLDASPMQPIRSEPAAGALDDYDRFYGLTTLTSTAGYAAQHLSDSSGPFARVQVTRRVPSLLFGTQFGLPPLLPALDGVPISARVQVRARTAWRFTLSSNSVSIGGERPSDVRVSRTATGGWDTLVVRTPRLTAVSSGATLVLGVEGLASGDWFDVREVSLFVGTLP